MYVYLNGKIIPSKEATVSVYDHGFLYGDGVYETMRVYDGVVFMIEKHLQRLFRSASMIGLDLPAPLENLKIALYETLIANRLKNAYVRLTVSRGKGAIGLDPDLCEKPTTVIFAQDFIPYPLSFYRNGISLAIADTRRNSRQAIDPRIKSLNFLNNILAKIEAKKQGAQEAIMLNTEDQLTEGTVSNFFFVKRDILCTPSEDCGILDGITRNLALELARREDISVEEGKFSSKDISSAEEVFITNTTMEVMPVSRVGNFTYRVGPMAKLLRKLYLREVNAVVADAKAKGPSLWAETE